jgi:hypothetical protein
MAHSPDADLGMGCCWQRQKGAGKRRVGCLSRMVGEKSYLTLSPVMAMIRVHLDTGILQTQYPCLSAWPMVL